LCYVQFRFQVFNQVHYTVTKKVVGVFIAFFVRRFNLALFHHHYSLNKSKRAKKPGNFRR
jgi:hypothetical protein